MSSISMKKRRKTDDSVEQDNDYGPSSGNGRKLVKRSASKPKPRVDNPGFVSLKEKLCRMGNTEVMNHFEPVFRQQQQVLSSTVPPNGIPAFAREGVIDCRWALAAYHDLYARPTGDVVGSGQEDTGQLGLVRLIGKDNDDGFPPTLLQDLRGKVIQVAAGGMHSMGLTHGGSVYTWGCGDDGALGRLLTQEDAQREQTTPTEVTKLFPSKQRVSTHVIRSPDNEWKDVIAIDAGNSHSLFLTISGNVYTSGKYRDSDGKNVCEERPSDCPIQSDKRAKGSVVGMNFEPVHVYKLPGRAKFIAAGGSINAVILEKDEQCYTWGMGELGELARSDEMTDLTDEDGMPDIGKNFHMYLKDLYDEENGKHYKDLVFDEDVLKEHFLTPKPVLWDKSLPKIQRIVTHVACGQNHILVAARAPEDSSSRVYTAGQGAMGRLGHGDEVNRHALTLVEALKDVPISRVAGGQKHSLILHAKGDTVYACGHNGFYQCGLAESIHAADDIARGLDPDKKDKFVLLPTPVPLPIPTDKRLDKIGRIVDISCGENHSFAVTAGGRLYSFGFNSYGQCGTDPRVSDDDVTPRLNHDWFGANTQVFVHHVAGGAQHSLFVASRFKKEEL